MIRDFELEVFFDRRQHEHMLHMLLFLGVFSESNDSCFLRWDLFSGLTDFCFVVCWEGFTGVASLLPFGGADCGLAGPSPRAFPDSG